MAEALDRAKVNPWKFYNIPHLQKKNMNDLVPGMFIWVEEKIDGSNVSCEVDVNGIFRCYGRNYEIGEWHSQNGAYEQLCAIKSKVIDKLNKGLVLYFEYLVKHHVKYAPEFERGLYLIGVYNKRTGQYLIPDEVYSIADETRVKRPSTFFKGEFTSWQDLERYVGQTEFGAVKGEGIVVKFPDEMYGTRMIKIVSEEFREVMKVDASAKKREMEKVQDLEKEIETVVTPARVRKQLYALMDLGEISSVDDMTEVDKQIAHKMIGALVIKDCMKEEPEFCAKYGKMFGKYAAEIARKYIKSEQL